VRVRTTPIFEGKAAVPRPELPWQAGPQEEPLMMALPAEVMTLETRLLTRLEHEGPVVELEHETALAEVTKLEAWGMSRPGCESPVVKVPEVP
jgi:hypothetical protein